MSASGPADDRIIEAWLLDGVDAAPPPVVRAALDQIANTRQRRELTIMRRIHNMDGTAVLNQRPFLKPALIGLVGLVALIAIFGLLRFIAIPSQIRRRPCRPHEPSSSSWISPRRWIPPRA